MSARPINSTCTEFDSVTKQIKELELKREGLRSELLSNGPTMTRDWILTVESCNRLTPNLETLKRLFSIEELREKKIVREVSFMKVKLSPRKGYKE